MRIGLILLLTILTCATNAQSIYYNKIFGNNSRNEAGFAIAAANNNYFVTGISTSRDSIIPRSSLTICLNQNGDTIWTRQDSLNNPVGNDIEIMGSSIYEVGNAAFYSSPKRQEFFLQKLRLNGDTVWTKYIRFRVYDFPQYLITTNDDGLVIVATLSTDSSVNNYTDINDKSYIIKTDSDGNIKWIDSTLVNAYGNAAYAGVESKDNSFTIVGFYDIPGSGLFTNYGAALVFKIDSNGNRLWYKSYKSPTVNGDEEAWCIIQTPDNGYLVGGYTSLGFMQVNNPFSEYYGNFVMKIDSSGNMQWQRTYGGDSLESWGFRQIRKTLDGNYILVAPWQKYNADTSEAYLLKIDSAGNELFSRKFYRPIYPSSVVDNRPYDILATPDSGFIFVGSSFDTTQRVWVVKTDKYGCDSVGCQLPTAINSLQQQNSSFNIYPNPALSQTTVLYSVPESAQQVNLFVYDITGRVVEQQPLDKYSHQATFDVGNFAAGMYLVELKTDGGNVVKKLAVE